jgi:hypothetical protein
MLALAGCGRIGGEAFQATHNGAVPVTGAIGQTFRPATGAIRGVDLLTATYGRQADPGGTLTVTLTDAATGLRIGAASVGGAQIGDNRWVAVRFSPPVAAPEVAAVTVRWTGRTPIALRVNAPPPRLDRTVQDINDPYPGGELLVDGGRAAGDLAFRVVGTGGAADAAGQAGGMIRSAGGRLLRNELPFAVAWLGLLGVACGLACSGFVRRRRTEQLAGGGSGEQDQEGGDRGREDARRQPAELL